MEYEDFSIKIEPRQGETYPVIVLRSPAGEGRGVFRPPFDPQKLAEYAPNLDEAVRHHQPQQRQVSAGAVASLPQRIGDQLFTALFSGPVLSLLDRSLGMLHGQERGLRIKLHIDPEDPSLATLVSLPWEYLYRKETRDFLNLSRFTPILRYLDVQRPYIPLMLQPPLRILVVSSDPGDYPRLDLESERQRMDDCLGRLENVQADYLVHATPMALQERLSDGQYHALHYMGHGGFDENSGDGALLLENEQGYSELLDGRTLGVLLHDAANLRLVFLNACETARLSRQAGRDPFAGVASALVMAGVPAVVAMQFPISDRGAVTFSQKFYGLLARGRPVDEAVAEGRRAIRLAEPETLEWGTPVLFMRSPEGVIFTLGKDAIPSAEKLTRKPTTGPTRSLDRETEEKIKKRYNDGLEAYWLKDWEWAAACFQGVLELQPENAEVAARLEEVYRQQKLLQLERQAGDAEQASNWAEAAIALEALLEVDPNYPQAASRLSAVLHQQRLAELYTQALSLGESQKWQAVLSVFASIDALQPDYYDPSGLRAKAQEAVIALQRQQELDGRYEQALVEMDAGQWEAAEAHLLQIQEQQRGYRKTVELLGRAHSERKAQVERETRLAEEQERQKQEQEKQDKIAVLYRHAESYLAKGEYQAALGVLYQIRALDDKFQDPLGIGEHAQEGLERLHEQQSEAQAEQVRQQELVRRYNEAVGLLKSGQDQAALDAWQEIVAQDPSFHDRKNVAGKAQRKLDAQTRPPTAGRIPRWLYYIAGALALVVIIAWLYSGLKDMGVLRLPIYDDFDDPTYDQTFNKKLWHYGHRASSNNVAYQAYGFLRLVSNEREGMGEVQFIQEGSIPITKPTIIELHMKLDAVQEGTATAGIVSGDPHWISPTCLLSNRPNTTLTCRLESIDLFTKEVEDRSWHTVRFEIDPDTKYLSIYIDKILEVHQTIEYSFQPGGSGFSLMLNTYNGISFIDSGTPVSGLFDDVRISPAP